MKYTDVLGINARNRLFSYQYNSPKGKSIASSKLRTKRYLEEANVAIPKIYGKFRDLRATTIFRWEDLPSSFALKPNKGMGGEGIIVVKKRSKDEKGWITTQRKKVSIEDLKLHTMDILEGAYSIGKVPDMAYLEEYIGRHKAFKNMLIAGRLTYG